MPEPIDFEALLADIERREAESAAEMPDTTAALGVLFRAYERLRKLGWREIMYAPGDGKAVEVIEAGSTGVHRAQRMTHNDEGWWIEDGGDLWPARPILFRLDPVDEAARAARMAAAAVRAAEEKPNA